MSEPRTYDVGCGVIVAAAIVAVAVVLIVSMLVTHTGITVKTP